MLINAIRAILSDVVRQPDIEYPFFVYVSFSGMTRSLNLNYPQISQTLNIPDLERRLKAKSRARKLVDIRRALSAILVEQGYSVREIAAELCRPHSTVVHFVQTHESLFTTDTAYQHLFHQLRDITQWQS